MRFQLQGWKGGSSASGANSFMQRSSAHVGWLVSPGCPQVPPTWRPGNGVRPSPVVTVALASQVYFTSYYSTWRVAEDAHGGQAGSLMKEALLHFYQKMLGNSWKLAEGIPQRLVKTEMARESCTYSDTKRQKNENMHRCNSSRFCTFFLVEPPSHSCFSCDLSMLFFFFRKMTQSRAADSRFEVGNQCLFGLSPVGSIHEGNAPSPVVVKL